jgi:putative lipoprotein
VSEQTIPTEGKQVPFPYTLPYDPAKIIESHTYAVQARIESGGTLLFINTTQVTVITRGNPTENVEVIVQPVGETPTQPATLPTTGGVVFPIAAALASALAGAGLLLRRTTR